MALEIKQKAQGTLAILTLVGQLDTETAPDFELAAHDLFEAGGRQFVVDLRQITSVSSAGLRVLLALAKRVEGAGALRLCALQPAVKEMFEKSGYARLFQIFPRLDAALAGIPGVDSLSIAARPQAGGHLAADVNRLMGGGAPAPAPARAPNLARGIRAAPARSRAPDLLADPILRQTNKLPAAGAHTSERARSWRDWFRRKDRVDTAVFAPPKVGPGQNFLVQVFAYLPAHGQAVQQLAREFDDEAQQRGVATLGLKIPAGTPIQFQLSMPGLEIECGHAKLVWQRPHCSAQFAVKVPMNATAGAIIGTLTVSIGNVPVGHIKFKLQVTSAGSHETAIAVGETARQYRHAFVSYASADRAEVLKRVQMLARLRIQFFQDVLSLESGARWEKELNDQIERSDVFLLFWSTAASRSQWVRDELRYALHRSSSSADGLPEILPIVLEGPPPPPPPPELAHLHFNDYLLYLMQASN